MSLLLHKNKPKIIDLVNQKFGKLTVIEQNLSIAAQLHKEKRGYWKCKCDCGNEVTVSQHSLASRNTQSCGCLQKQKIRQTGQNNKGRPAYNTMPYPVQRNVFREYRYRAKRKKIEFNLTFESFLDITGQTCFYCGLEPTQTRNYLGSKFRTIVYNGIDRLDSSMGYVKENVVPCCRYCNTAKNNMSLQEFITWVTRTYKYLEQKKLL